MKSRKFTSLTMALMATAAMMGCADMSQSSLMSSSRNFAEEVTFNNTFEFESSKLALRKSKNPEVRAFAQQMLSEHRLTENRLVSAIDRSQVRNVPFDNELDSRHEAILQDLQRSSGADFDRKYMDAQRRAHSNTVVFLRDYAIRGEDPALVGFAQETLPKVENHERQVYNMNY